MCILCLLSDLRDSMPGMGVGMLGDLKKMILKFIYTQDIIHRCDKYINLY